METLLTVVIPAYNAEKYIKYTLDSLCDECTNKRLVLEKPEISDMEKGETEPDARYQENGQSCLEVLVVDDGSKDHTGKIADQYAKIYPDTVRVIHKENGGHGSGINCGIREARGRYLKVVDADDWVEPEAFSNLLDALAHTSDDAVVSGFYWRFDNGSGEESSFPSKAEMKEPFKGVKYGKSYVLDGIADQVYMKMHGITWRTEILRQMPLSIDEHCYYVDAEYILYPIPWVRTVSFLPDFVYQYRIGRAGQSVSPEKMVQNKKNYDRVLESLCAFYQKCRNGEINCSEEKLRYIENGIARVAAGRVKILLSLPADKKVRNQLVRFDKELLEKYPGIYHANRNKAVKALRMSWYRLYGAAVWALKHQKRQF